MNECYNCGFWDSDREGCACPSYEMWYACPIESAKPENQKELEEYAKWVNERRNNNGSNNNRYGNAK